MIEGRPFIRSSVSRIGPAARLPANSVRKSAIRTPSGIAITVAIATITAVPTSSGPIPVGARREDEVEADRLGAAGDDRVDDDRQHGDRQRPRRRSRAYSATRLKICRRRRLPLGVSGAVGSGTAAAHRASPPCS